MTSRYTFSIPRGGDPPALAPCPLEKASRLHIQVSSCAAPTAVEQSCCSSNIKLLEITRLLRRLIKNGYFSMETCAPGSQCWIPCPSNMPTVGSGCPIAHRISQQGKRNCADTKAGALYPNTLCRTPGPKSEDTTCGAREVAAERPFLPQAAHQRYASYFKVV